MFARFMRGRTAFRRLVLIAAISTVVYTLIVGLHIGGERFALWVDDLGLALASSAAGVAAWFVAARREERSHLAWRLIAIAAFLWSAGETAWAVYELILGREVPFPSWADAFYLAGTLMAVAAVVFLGPKAEGNAGSLRRLLDGFILGASLLLVSWVVVLRDVATTSTDGRLALGVSLAYPVGDVVTLAVVISVATHARQRGRQAMLILTAGLVAMALTDSLFMELAAHDAYTGGFIESGWFLAYVLLGLAALRELSAHDDEHVQSARLRFANLMVPYGAAVVSITVRIHQEVIGQNGPFLFWCGAIITLMVLARLMMTILENFSLARSLEHKVEERTAELATRERQFRSLVQNSSDIVMLLNSDGVIISASASTKAILGLEPATLVGERLLELVHADDIANVQVGLANARNRHGGTYQIVEYRLRSEAGQWRNLETTIANLLDDPDVRGLVLNCRDVSERKGLEAELTRQAFHDSLTDLANRALFRERIDHALTRRDRLDHPIGVLFLDLDGFKSVNDAFGHEIGDELLRQVGRRLVTCTRPGDTVARLGGDEFGILLESMSDPAITSALAERCISALREPFELGDKQVFTDVSIGIAITNAIENADELLRNADVAMYEVKSRGGGAFQMFDPRLHATLLRRVELGRDLRGAMERGELSVRYQPVYILSDGRLEGAEALIRWEHPERGEITPDQFISIAEETGLIVPIGEWVLRRAAEAIVRWSAIDPSIKIAVNISARQLQEANFIDRVAAVVGETGLDPTHLVLEITESTLMQDTEEMIERLRALKQTGVRIAIDDFGTGYSSLSYLRRLPTDFLKIDRSFVKGIDRGPEDSALTRAIVKLSNTFGLHTVAEGIETEAQADVLKSIGCELGQGFLFAKPLKDADFEALLSESAGESMAPTYVMRSSGR